MKRHLVRVLALAAAFLLTACAARLPSPEARRAPSTAESAVSAAPEALEPAPPLAVSLGDRAELVEAGAEAPVFPVSDPAELPLLPGGYAVTVTDAGGGTVFAGESGELGGFLPARNGGYAYEAAAGGTLYRFTVDCAFPVQLSLNAAARQGETVVLRTLYADGAELSAESDLGFSPRFFSAGDGSQIALLPVRYTTPAGVYGLTVTAGDEVLTREIVVEQREFEVQYLEMDAATAEETALSAAANAEWEEKVEPLKAVADPVQYWEGPFLQPVSGEITTQFGCIRYTNDDPTPSRHGGDRHRRQNGHRRARRQQRPRALRRAHPAHRQHGRHRARLRPQELLLPHGFSLRLRRRRRQKGRQDRRGGHHRLFDRAAPALRAGGEQRFREPVDRLRSRHLTRSGKKAPGRRPGAFYFGS